MVALGFGSHDLLTVVLHAELTGFAALSGALSDGAVGAEELGVAVNRCLEPLRAFAERASDFCSFFKRPQLLNAALCRPNVCFYPASLCF